MGNVQRMNSRKARIIREFCVKEIQESKKTLADFESGNVSILAKTKSGKLRDVTKYRANRSLQIINNVEVFLKKLDRD